MDEIECDYENPWIYCGEPFTGSLIGENYGFVYLLENINTQKKYIGKKFFYSQKTKVVKGKKKKYLAESDWKSYYGSNKLLLSDLTKEDKPNVIRREILRLCKNKTTTNYFELKEQILRDVLLDVGYYNEFVGTRISGKFIYE